MKRTFAIINSKGKKIGRYLSNNPLHAASKAFSKSKRRSATISLVETTRNSSKQTFHFKAQKRSLKQPKIVNYNGKIIEKKHVNDLKLSKSSINDAQFFFLEGYKHSENWQSILNKLNKHKIKQIEFIWSFTKSFKTILSNYSKKLSKIGIDSSQLLNTINNINNSESQSLNSFNTELLLYSLGTLCYLIKTHLTIDINIFDHIKELHPRS